MIMPIRRELLAVSAGLLLLGGCALQPQPDEGDRLDELLTTSRFNDRIGELEATLATSCQVQEASRQGQQDRLERVGADVREIGGLVRALRADVETLDNEPGVVMPECPSDDIAALENKTLLGRTEWVGFPNVGTYLKARVDSGANTASLSAREITEFEREGEDWVRFKLALDEDAVAIDAVRDKWIEAEVVRRVRIIQASGEESRPVVSLLMELGPIKQNVEFTLNNRTHLNYPVLLGRRFMMDIALIDVAQAYLHERPEYPGGESAEMAAEDEAGDRVDDDEDE
ncbi:RimK/LysX family protein [Halomonas sp. McH1-25]|uniref:ATP-dependent zinc protease family protein n=1 Tax=unclassified Halomonas TaxID=2609666 RepID=UPI001EF4C272|nr:MULTISPECIES: RimK/LysX family protein [unclassified Halomonas]MCG7598463.1 RimK/LysX family protein [Halomonas sp. McH1-25]MCP1343456.1 RimK/LysX family protein [Halomonas sp. FL8]MCP1361370.1 RimK/LysX family protein [Halomonas sp. BBD45]MCP1365509.1 RimK/LysX family protein [Halomonas sp. BBD48]